jgi:hypothetical protein
MWSFFVDLGWASEKNFETMLELEAEQKKDSTMTQLFRCWFSAFTVNQRVFAQF